MNVSRVSTLFALTIALAGCGGGSGSSSDGGTTGGSKPAAKTPAQIIADAKSFTTSQLNTAARTLADNSYNGSESKAGLDIALAQQVYRMMFDDNLLVVPEITEQLNASELAEDGSIDTTLDCERGGSVSYNGQFQDSGIGKVTLKFDNCISFYDDFATSGVAAISIDSLNDATSYSIYFNDLTWEHQEPVSISGVMVFNNNIDHQTGLNTAVSGQYVTAKIGDETFFVESEMSEKYSYYGLETHVEGRMSVASRGYVDFSLTSDEYISPYFNYSTFYLNNNEAYLNFSGESVMYVADTDGDGEKDSGKVIDLYEFISTPVTDLALLPLSDISSQPQAESLNVITEKPVVSSDIVVEPGIYYDNETPQEQLTVSYNWYINNVLVEGLDGNTLPAFSAAPEDTVEVSMVVSDESHSVESYRHYIWIEDTPAVLTASSVPESISAGDTVTFSVVLTDADIDGDDNLAKLTHAPEGASMADDGTVTWQVPKSLLFNQQSYSFGFSNRLNPNHHIEQTFSLVATAQQPMPLFRSGIEVPKYNQSQWIADFDGDGNNELLGTDSYQRIFLLELVEGKYQQKWAYPYVLNEEEIVRQVLPADIDKDGAPEILILTDHGIWLIEDIYKPASKMFETEAYIHSAIIADTDGDGTDEIIYRTSDSEYSSDTAQVTVAELNDDLTEIFTFYTDAISDMAVGNVDSDANQELVLNNGIVYDLTTGANEWYLGTGFGSSFVTVGDMNGDGIDEIVGVDSWSNMYVFSAVDKSQLSSLSVSDTCDTRAFNLYNDSTDEVLVSDCQWGNVTAYTLNASNQLEAIWQVDLQDHGSTSLAVGDIDNDGANEVLWGSGVSSSGADVLVTADFTADSATLKASTTGAQLDSFSASGWSEIAPGDERGVFLVPSTESGYSGMAVATLTQEGQVTTSNELSSGWRYSNYSATTDFNNDGAGDIFLPAADSNTEGFGVFQLSDMSVHWAMASNGSSDVGQIKAMDVNGDGYDDAIVADGKTLKVFDIQNQLQLASYSFASTISGFDAVIIDGTLNVVVTQYELLQLLKMGASSFSAHGFVEDLYCNNVRFFGNDEDKSLVCWGADSYFQTLSLVDNEFGAIKHIATDFRVNDIEVDPTDPNRFLIASHASDGWGTAFSKIHSVTSDGYVIWSSPSLIGSANDASLRVREQADGKLEILFGSSYGMYWIH